MEPRYSVVVVHGINGKTGNTQGEFSESLENLVITDKLVQKKFWYEAIWEGIYDNLDVEIKKIVTELVNSYDFEDYFQTRMAKKRGVKKIIAHMGIFASLFAKGVVADFVSEILDYALDLPLYLGNAYGEQMREIVEKKIHDAYEQTGGVVVIGHSLGSVIAYDVVANLLMNDNPTNVMGLVTMGSPLGWVTALRKTHNCVSANPSLFESLKWVNFYNEVDPVPMKKALSRDTFPNVDNIKISVKTKNPLVAHSAYWSDRNVAAHIKSLIFTDFD